ncbi:MAG: hypothetical protein GXP49_18620, partial [Deltaproteobacteria bacterium]|nr:hypothetical protein [Deltaproteobacteria bacterium]
MQISVLFTAGIIVSSCGSDATKANHGDNIEPKVVLSPPGGVFNKDFSVTAVSQPDGLDIYCSADGTNPKQDAGHRYSGPISISNEGTTKIKCICVSGRGVASKPAEETYLLDKTAPSSSILPEAEEQNKAFKIEFKARDNIDPSPVVLYTLDGTTPQPGMSSEYSGPFDAGVEQGKEGKLSVSFRAMDQAGNLEQVREKTYLYDLKAPSCSVSPGGGAYNQGVTLNITCDEESKIYYTINGSEPSTGSNLYNGPILLDKEGEYTLKFFAKDVFGNQSEVKTIAYFVDFTPPESSADIDPGHYNHALLIKLAANEEGAEIFYTLDGSEPVKGSRTTVKYQDPISLEEEGRYKIRFFAIDKAGNEEQTKHENVYFLDFTPPSCSINPRGDAAAPGRIFNKDIEIELSCTEESIEYYTLDKTEPSINSDRFENQLVLSQEGSILLRIRPLDIAGNWGETKDNWYLLDKTGPTSSASPAQGSYKPPLQVYLEATDNLTSGNVYYTVDHDGDIDDNNLGGIFRPGDIVLNQEGEHTVRFRARDNANNWEAQTNSVTYFVDSTPPVTAVIPPGTDKKPGMAIKSTVTIALSASDNDQVESTYYTIDGSDPGADSPKWSGTPISFSQEGEYTLRVSSIDLAGNTEAPTSHFYRVDNTVPVVSCSVVDGAYRPPLSILPTCIDNMTGCTIDFELYKDGKLEQQGEINGPLILKDDGNYRLDLVGVDGALNKSEKSSFSYRVDGTPPVTTVSPAGDTNLPGAAINYLPLVIELKAEDPGNSGGQVAEIRYTVDGSDPQSAGAQIYSPSNKPTFNFDSDSSVLRFFAIDDLGNAEKQRIEYYRIDTVPPGAVQDLAMGDLRGRLSWTSTGDDYDTGNAVSYDIRWSNEEITEENWADPTKVFPLDNEPDPASPGTLQKAIFPGFAPDMSESPKNEYFFAMKVIDDVGNMSSLSNVASGWYKMKSAQLDGTGYGPDIAVLGDIGNGGSTNDDG